MLVEYEGQCKTMPWFQNAQCQRVRIMTREVDNL